MTRWAQTLVERTGAVVVSGPDPADSITDAAGAYAQAAMRVDGPVVLLPQLSGECYAASCVAALRLGDGARVAGWMHTDIAYDRAMLVAFGSCLSAVGAVSEASATALRGQLDSGLVRAVPTGVEMPHVARRTTERDLRLVYTGRLERDQKRVLALPAAVRTLRARGVDCSLVIVGSGPAEAELRASSCEGVRFTGELSRDDLARELASSDICLLPSRTEGLGLSRIEAALLGCVPVVCSGSAGALEGVEHGVTGIVAQAGPDASEEEAGESIGRAIAEFLGDAGRDGLARLGEAAQAECRRRFSKRRFAESVRSLCESCFEGKAPVEAWRRIASDPGRAARFTVPMDAIERTRDALDAMGEEGFWIYGGGEHLRAVWPVFEGDLQRLRGIIDDNPEVQGSWFGGVPIVSLNEARRKGLGRVLVSSLIHREAMVRKLGDSCEVVQTYAAARAVSSSS